MILEKLTENYAVSEHKKSTLIEIWVDWEPYVDGGARQALQGYIEGKDLIIRENPAVGEPLSQRRLVGLMPDLLRRLENGFEWVTCAPSGVISRRKILPFRLS